MRKREHISWGIALLYGLVIAGYPLISILPLLLKTESQPISVSFRAFVLALSIAIIIFVIGKKRSYKGIFWLPLLVFWSFYIFRLVSDTILFPINLGFEVSTYYSFIFGVSLIPMLAFFMVSTDEQTLKRAFNMTVVVVTVASIIALYFNFTVALVENLKMLNVGRMYSETLNPISLGHLGVSSVLLSSFFLLLNKTASWLHKGFFISLLLLGLFTTGLAASRGPAMALIVGIIILIFSEFQLKTSLRILSFSTIFFTTIYVGAYYIEETFGFLIISRVQTTIDEGGDLNRFQLFTDAWNQFLDNPLLGSALEELNSQYYPHNVVIESFMATGFIGGTAFCLLIVMSLIATFRLMRTQVNNKWIALLYVQYLTGALFSGALWASNTMWCLMVAVVSLSYRIMPQTSTKSQMLTNS